MTDYKKYSLENLENWLHDALSCDEASPHEIYSVIRKVVQDEYNYHKEQSQKCLGVLELMSGHRPINLEINDEVQDDVFNNVFDARGEKSEVDKHLEWQKDAVKEFSKVFAEEDKKPLTYDEAVSAGWSMTDDGIWWPPQEESKVTKFS